MSGQSPRRSLRLIALLVAVIVTASVVVVVWFPRSPSSAHPLGLTFGEVSVNAARQMDNASGAPWTLTSALGVLSPGPVWLNPIGDELCRDVPGVSVWNASLMPTAPDQLVSGVVPFWSLIYMNSSRYLVDVVSTGTSIHLGGAIAPTSPCGILMDRVLGNFTASPVLDSPEAASRAWSLEGSTYMKLNPGAFEFYETGGGQLQFWGSTVGAWIVGYQLCGLPSYMGSVNTQTDELKFENTSGLYFSINSTGTCTQSDYRVSFDTPTNASGPGFVTLTSVSLSIGFANSSNTTDGWGLTTGSTRISMVNESVNEAYLASPLSCSMANLSLETCGQPAQWYAVLSSPTGYWLDAYGNLGGNFRWILPNVPFYTGDSLLIVHHDFASADAFGLSIVSASTAIHVSGSVTI